MPNKITEPLQARRKTQKGKKWLKWDDFYEPSCIATIDPVAIGTFALLTSAQCLATKLFTKPSAKSPEV